MFNTVEVPQAIIGSFKRVARRIPVELKKDDELLKTVIDYLQLGGEKLARQLVDAARQTLELENIQRKKKSREDALIRAAEARLAAADGDVGIGEDDDEDNEDDDDDMKDY